MTVALVAETFNGNVCFTFFRTFSLSGELHASTAGATSRGEGHSGSDHPRIVNMCAVIKLLTTALIHR